MAIRMFPLVMNVSKLQVTFAGFLLHLHILQHKCANVQHQKYKHRSEFGSSNKGFVLIKIEPKQTDIFCDNA